MAFRTIGVLALLACACSSKAKSHDDSTAGSSTIATATTGNGTGSTATSDIAGTAQLAQTPPLGWNTWNRFGCTISEDLVKAMADTLVSSGMLSAGYQYLNIDDCWQTSRDANGTIVADPATFPSGIKALADYAHSKGLKLGIYTDVGTATCQGRPGSLGHEAQDAQTYASWGIDYVKTDWCNTDNQVASERYQSMGTALQGAGRPMVYSICNWGEQQTPVWAPALGNLWRTAPDIYDSWASVMSTLDINARLGAVASPGHWNDPDMLEVGNGGMTADEYRSHFSLWSMMAAPLIAGNDLRSMTSDTAKILLNAEILAIDQDSLGVQGVRIGPPADQEVWSKPLAAAGSRAVLLLNRASAPAQINVTWSQIGLQPSASARDLWAHQDLGTTTSYGAMVPSHGVVMLKVQGQEGEIPPGTSKLSELPWQYTANYWGPVEHDAANGEETTVGGPLSISGQTYATGLGVHAPSRVRYVVGGHCKTFRAVVGLDDEVGAHGSVIFEVWADGTKLFASNTITPAQRSQTVQVDVTGRKTLDLVVNTGNGVFDYDHSDWANAFLDCQ